MSICACVCICVCGGEDDRFIFVLEIYSLFNIYMFLVNFYSNVEI